MTSEKVFKVSGILLFLIFLPFIYMLIEFSILSQFFHPQGITVGLMWSMVWIGWGIAPLLLLTLFGFWIYAFIQHQNKK